MLYFNLRVAGVPLFKADRGTPPVMGLLPIYRSTESKKLESQKLEPADMGWRRRPRALADGRGRSPHPSDTPRAAPRRAPRAPAPRRAGRDAARAELDASARSGRCDGGVLAAPRRRSLPVRTVYGSQHGAAGRPWRSPPCLQRAVYACRARNRTWCTHGRLAGASATTGAVLRGRSLARPAASRRPQQRSSAVERRSGCEHRITRSHMLPPTRRSHAPPFRFVTSACHSASLGSRGSRRRRQGRRNGSASRRRTAGCAAAWRASCAVQHR